MNMYKYIYNIYIYMNMYKYIYRYNIYIYIALLCTALFQKCMYVLFNFNYGVRLNKNMHALLKQYNT